MNANFAILSGVCASAASLFGKLSGLHIFEDYFLVRVIFFALMIVCNAGVWTLFVKALQESESSLSATVISAASNYFLSGLMGFFIFNEVTSLFWWCGMFLIISGLLFILRDQSDEHIKNE